MGAQVSLEFSRRKGDFALAMAVAALRLENGTVPPARSAGWAQDRSRPTPLRLVELGGRACRARRPHKLGREALSEVAAGAAELVNPPSDIHGPRIIAALLSPSPVCQAGPLFDGGLDDAAT